MGHGTEISDKIEAKKCLSTILPLHQLRADRRIDINPAGGVLFNVNGTELRTSSKVLCVISQYFRNMFRPEGRALAQRYGMLPFDP